MTCGIIETPGSGKAARRKVLCVFGTRPEAIKLSPVIRCLRSRATEFDVQVCSTGQHKSMLAQVLRTFQISVERELGVMQHDQTPGAVVARVLQQLGPVVDEWRPDWLLVQGDTSTAAAAALTGFYHQVKVGHVEAGLRASSRWEPFPEETNRRLVSVLAEHHFAPTSRARDHLLREGISTDCITITGNTGIDALHWALALPPRTEAAPLARTNNRKVVLVTVHRRENLGSPLVRILSALRELALRFREELHLILPVHLNPKVLHPVRSALSGFENVTLTEPLDYLSLLHALQISHFVLTDSGGLQEEAPALGKPVLVMRESTERPEGVAAGGARLVGSDPDCILSEVTRLLRNPQAYSSMSRAINPYGDGRAAGRIANILAGKPADEFRPKTAVAQGLSPAQLE